MSGLSVSSSASSSPKPADPEPSAKTHTVSAMFLDTGDAGCCSSEKKSPEAGKTEYHDLDSYVPSTYSRKVFIGGLPPDLDADDIKRHFIQFGDLLVDWPHKARTRALFPPKGYAFLLFRQEVAIHRLLQACLQQDGKFFVFLSSTSLKDKKVQVRPWFIADSEYKHHPGQGPDPRKTVFIGGVPRPMRACELADIMNERFGHVSYAAIDLDTDVNYPKGAGRVSFTSTNSFISAVSSRFFQMTYGDVNKGVEVKPYVMDDQMCDECHGVQCNGKFAPFYCGSVSCLQYYCEHCWATVHALPSKQLHRPLTKDTGDRPRAMPFRGHFN